MSQHDYTLVANTRLIDLPALPVGLVGVVSENGK